MAKTSKWFYFLPVTATIENYRQFPLKCRQHSIAENIVNNLQEHRQFSTTSEKKGSSAPAAAVAALRFKTVHNLQRCLYNLDPEGWCAVIICVSLSASHCNSVSFMVTRQLNVVRFRRQVQCRYYGWRYRGAKTCYGTKIQ